MDAGAISLTTGVGTGGGTDAPDEHALNTVAKSPTKRGIYAALRLTIPTIYKTLVLVKYKDFYIVVTRWLSTSQERYSPAYKKKRTNKTCWNMKNVFVSGPIFSEGEMWFIKQVVSAIEKLGFKAVWAFMEERELIVDKKLAGKEWTEKVYLFITGRIDKCDLVVAILDGVDVDSGTAWEIGYAVGKGKKVIGIKTDERIYAKDQSVNLMIQESVKVVKSLEELGEELSNLK